MKIQTFRLLPIMALILAAMVNGCSRPIAAEEQRSISISGRVWLDANGDGVQDTGEAGLTGAPVRLMSGRMAMAVVETGVDGTYRFEKRLGGEYEVVFEAPPGFSFSPKDQGDDDLDSDANPASGQTDTMLVDDGMAVENVDAGLIPPGPGSDIQ